MFSVKHLGLSSVKGRFNELEGFAVVKNGVITEARATIQVKSVDTALQERDEHLRSADFFDVSSYPTITFKQSVLRKTGCMENGIIFGTEELPWLGILQCMVSLGSCDSRRNRLDQPGTAWQT
jgi:hypothetical protein